MRNILLTFPALAATAHVASAAGIISINLVTTDGNPAAFPDRQEVQSDDAAGIAAASAINWNNAPALNKNASSGTTIVLTGANGNTNDNDGNATTTNLTLTANGGGSFVNNIVETNTGNDAMMNGYNSLSTIAWSVLPTDFTTNGYNIYVYFNGNNTFTSGNLGASVAGVGDPVFGKDPNNNAAFNGVFTRAIGDSAATANNSNYFLFENLTAASGTLNFTSSSASNRIPITGIQFVAIPEPSAALLGALGFVGLLRRRR